MSEKVQSKSKQIIVVDDRIYRDEQLKKVVERAVAEVLSQPKGAGSGDRPGVKAVEVREYLQKEDELQGLFRGGGAECFVLLAEDFREVELALRQATDPRAILLDQVFSEPNLNMLSFNLQPYRGDSAPSRDLVQNQGLLIAKYLKEKFKYFCPPILLFTSQGRSYYEASEMLSEGIIWDYQDKPGETQGPAYQNLVEFLRNYLNPLSKLDILESRGYLIDNSFRRFISDKLDCWRISTAEIIDALADLADLENTRQLNLKLFQKALEKKLLPENRHLWDSDEFWTLLLERFSDYREVKKPDNVREEAIYKRCKVFLGRAKSGSGSAILLFVNPKIIPSEVEDVRFHNKLPLPFLVPNTPQPYLLYWSYNYTGEIPQTSWLTLYDARKKNLRANKLLDSSRALVKNYSEGKFPINSKGIAPPDFIFTDEKEPENPSKWLIPNFTYHYLKVSELPEGDRPFIYNRKKNFQKIKDKLKVIIYWYIWGQFPDLMGQAKEREFGKEWRNIEKLHQQTALTISTNQLWRQLKEGRKTGEGYYYGYTYLFSPYYRLFGSRQDIRLKLEEKLLLNRFNFIISPFRDPDSGEARFLPTFDGLEFTNRVGLVKGAVKNEEGELKKLSFRNCTFRDEVRILGGEYSEILFRNCKIYGELKIQSFEGPIRFDSCEIEGQVLLQQLESESIEFQSCSGQGTVSIENAKIQDLYLNLSSGLSVKNCTVYQDFLGLSKGGNNHWNFEQFASERKFQIRGELGGVKISGGKFEGGIKLERLRVNGDVTLDNLAIEKVLLMRELKCTNLKIWDFSSLAPIDLRQLHCRGNFTLGKVEYDDSDTTPGGFIIRESLDICDGVIEGNLMAKRAIFGQEFLGTNLQVGGAVDFEGAIFEGTLRLDRSKLMGSKLSFRNAFSESRADLSDMECRTLPDFTGFRARDLVTLSGLKWTGKGSGGVLSFRASSLQGGVELNGIPALEEGKIRLDFSKAFFDKLSVSGDTLVKQMEERWRGMRTQGEKNSERFNDFAQEALQIVKILKEAGEFENADKVYVIFRKAVKNSGKLGFFERIWDNISYLSSRYGTSMGYPIFWAFVFSLLSGGVSYLSSGSFWTGFENTFFGEGEFSGFSLPNLAIFSFTFFSIIFMSVFFVVLTRKILKE